MLKATLVSNINTHIHMTTLSETKTIKLYIIIIQCLLCAKCMSIIVIRLCVDLYITCINFALLFYSIFSHYTCTAHICQSFYFISKFEADYVIIIRSIVKFDKNCYTCSTKSFKKTLNRNKNMNSFVIFLLGEGGGVEWFTIRLCGG